MRKKLTQRVKTILRKAPQKAAAVKAVSAPATKEKAKPAAAVSTGIGLHNLSVPSGAHKPRKLLGRGSSSGHGKTSTRGSKGQTSRSGRATYPGFEGGQMPLIRKIPKRGFTSIFRKTYQVINLKDLQKIKDTPITPEVLEQRGLIKDKEKPVKVLGDGEIKNPVTVSVHAASKAAADKIKNAGGRLEIINA